MTDETPEQARERRLTIIRRIEDGPVGMDLRRKPNQTSTYTQRVACAAMEAEAARERARTEAAEARVAELYAELRETRLKADEYGGRLLAAEEGRTLAAAKHLAGISTRNAQQARIEQLQARVAEVESERAHGLEVIRQHAETIHPASEPPDNAREVLVWVPASLSTGAHWRFCWYSQDAEAWFTDIGGNWKAHPTHWMELPPPPETKEPADE